MGVKLAGVFALSEDDIDDPEGPQAGQLGMRLEHLLVCRDSSSLVPSSKPLCVKLKALINGPGSGPWFNSPQIHAGSTRPPVDVSLCIRHSALHLGSR